MHKVSIQIISTKVKETKVETTTTITKRVNMSGMRTTIVKKATTIVKIETIGLGLMFPLKIENLVIGKLGVVCHKLRI